jgi:hypothetical protein
MSELVIDADTYAAIMALSQNFDVLGRMFQTGEGNPESLRMVVGGLREATTILERVCDQWEAAA